MISKNPLDILFADLKRDLLEQQRERRQLPHKPRQSTYANPLNWTPGRSICIVHITEGAVGIFREYFHRLSPTARRLLPAPPGTAVDQNELVFGDWWLHPRNSGPLEPDSEAETKAIIARFNELMDLELEPV